jgi:hypothetical protein
MNRELLMRFSYLAMAVTAFTFPTLAGAQTVSSPLTPFTQTQSIYTQNFDALASSNNATIAGFQRVETGSNANNTYAAGTGSANAGNIYSFGAVSGAAASDRALGSLGSGTLTSTRFGGIFTNGLGSAITSLVFGYTGEQWRAGNSAVDGLIFEYSTDATSLTNGTWLSSTSLNFAPVRTSGNTELNGNLAINQRAISGTIAGLSIANGASYGFRWTDRDSSGNDHGLAVDNLSINATIAPIVSAAPEPGTWAMMIIGFGAAGASLRRRKSKVMTRVAFA